MEHPISSSPKYNCMPLRSAAELQSREIPNSSLVSVYCHLLCYVRRTKKCQLACLATTLPRLEHDKVACRPTPPPVEIRCHQPRVGSSFYLPLYLYGAEGLNLPMYGSCLCSLYMNVHKQDRCTRINTQEVHH